MVDRKGTSTEGESREGDAEPKDLLQVESGKRDRS